MRLSIIIGFLAGLIGTFVAAYMAPFLPFERVRSETEVMTNGGRLERFNIRADDRLARLPGGDEAAAAPADARWYPELAPFSGSAQIFRLRNASGVVVGTASRISGISNGNDVEWLLHIPARGTMILSGASDDLVGVGDLVAGAGEFAELDGQWSSSRDGESWRIDTTVVAIVEDPDAAADAGGAAQ